MTNLPQTRLLPQFSLRVLSIIAVMAIMIFNPIIAFSDKSIISNYFTAYSDKSSYSAGDAIRIYGNTGSDEDNTVSMIIKTPSSDLVYIKQTTLHNKEFSFDFIAGGETWNESGNYVATITNGNSSVDVEFRFEEKTATTISVTADRTSYKEGDSIKISGKVTNPDSASKVSLVLKAPNGNIVSISQHNLSYDNTFSTILIAGDALMNASGVYSFVVQYGNENISDDGSFYYSVPVVTPAQTTSIKVSGLSHYVEYTISGGKLLSVIPVLNSDSLVLSIIASGDGSISVELPRKLIDAKIGNSSVDDSFFVLVDGNEVTFDEKTSSSTRTITIDFQAESKEIEIIGTRVESGQSTYTPKNMDSVAPLLLVPENIIINTQDSKARVDYTVKAIDDVDGILNPICNPVSGALFGIGDTLVTCSAKDSSGNKVQEKFLVTIQEESDNIPVWIKNVAGFWCSGEIDDDSFIEGIQYLIENNVIVMPKVTPNFGNSGEIPDWVKNNACWWSEGAISDDEFSTGIQYLISNGIVRVS